MKKLTYVVLVLVWGTLSFSQDAERKYNKTIKERFPTVDYNKPGPANEDQTPMKQY